MKKALAFLLGFVVIVYSCSPGRAQVELEIAFPGLSFNRPVDLQFPNDNSNRLFVVEQQGIIYSFSNDESENIKTVFLDIQDRVDNTGSEEGLLGLAFHPDYQNNGYFYVDYTASNPSRTVIARYKISDENPDSALKNSEFIILEVDQPYSNHNAGQILFGPDGYFYIALGDGGSGGDPQGNGQNLETLLGSILRIDVDQTSQDLNYAIPNDNPFVTNLRGFREEIYAYGLRNPWRISFDVETQWLWAADVGQNLYEEINIIEKGKNYGWKIMEGFHCFNASSCDTSDLTLPVWEYNHDVGQSITGGYVYRGTEVTELIGKYIYADFVSGRIWALEYDGDADPANSLLMETELNISTFGIDQNNELYACAFNGNIYKFKAMATAIEKSDDVKLKTSNLKQNYPNPFNSTTMISYYLENDAEVALEIYDIVGKLVKTLVRGRRSHGRQLSIWDGKDLRNNFVKSGLYFYTLKCNGFTETKKMLILN